MRRIALAASLLLSLCALIGAGRADTPSSAVYATPVLPGQSYPGVNANSEGWFDVGGFCKVVDVGDLSTLAPGAHGVPVFIPGPAAQWENYRTSAAAHYNGQLVLTTCCRPQANITTLCASATNPQSVSLQYGKLGEGDTVSATCIGPDGQYQESVTLTCTGASGVTATDNGPDGQADWIAGTDTDICAPGAKTISGACSVSCGGGTQTVSVLDSCGNVTSQTNMACNTQSCCTPTPGSCSGVCGGGSGTDSCGNSCVNSQACCEIGCVFDGGLGTSEGICNGFSAAYPGSPVAIGGPGDGVCYVFGPNYRNLPAYIATGWTSAVTAMYSGAAAKTQCPDLTDIQASGIDVNSYCTGAAGCGTCQTNCKDNCGNACTGGECVPACTTPTWSMCYATCLQYETDCAGNLIATRGCTGDICGSCVPQAGSCSCATSTDSCGNACSPSGCAPTACSPASVANGSVGAYPGCAITCNSGYTLSGTSCVADAQPPAATCHSGDTVSSCTPDSHPGYTCTDGPNQGQTFYDCGNECGPPYNSPVNGGYYSWVIVGCGNGTQCPNGTHYGCPDPGGTGPTCVLCN